MKLETVVYVLYLSLFGIYGAVLSICGLNLSNWRTWVLLAMTTIIGAVGVIRGKLDKGS